MFRRGVVGKMQSARETGKIAGFKWPNF